MRRVDLVLCHQPGSNHENGGTDDNEWGVVSQDGDEAAGNKTEDDEGEHERE